MTGEITGEIPQAGVKWHLLRVRLWVLDKCLPVGNSLWVTNWFTPWTLNREKFVKVCKSNSINHSKIKVEWHSKKNKVLCIGEQNLFKM